MTLSEYMAQHSLGDADMAPLLGLHRAQVSKLRRGESKPSLKTLSMIAQVTDGAVALDDFVPAEKAA